MIKKVIKKTVLVISALAVCWTSPKVFPIEFAIIFSASICGLAGYIATKIDEDNLL